MGSYGTVLGELVESVLGELVESGGATYVQARAHTCTPACMHTQPMHMGTGTFGKATKGVRWTI